MNHWSAYDPIADDYAAVAERVYFTEPARDLVARLALREGATMLDVGTGSGAIAAAAAAQHASVVACDVAVRMLFLTRRRIGRVAAGALPDLPFRERSFNAVTLGFVLSHVADVMASLREVRRVLAANGRVAIAAWTESPGSSAPGQLWQSVADRFVPVESATEALQGALPSEQKLADAAACRAVLIDAGFEEVQVEQKMYAVTVATTDYLRSRLISLTARYMLAQLTREEWERFKTESRQALERQFGNMLHFETSVLIATAVNG